METYSISQHSLDACIRNFISKNTLSNIYEGNCLGGIGTIVPGLFVKLRQGIYYEIGDEQQSKVQNIVIDW